MMLSLRERSAVSRRVGKEWTGEVRGHEGKLLSYAFVDDGGVDNETGCYLQR